MNWPSLLKDAAQIGAYLAGILAALFSVWQYRRNSRRERTRWIYDLYRRFWEQPSLRKMRERIDWGDTAFLEEEDKDVLSDFDDYLNFFEFIGYLWKSGELELTEISVMFDYSLRQLGQNKIIRSYLTKYGYEQLNALLDELRYSVRHDGHK
jgi:hypothetical protein